MAITRQMAGDITGEIEQALAPILEKYGLSLANKSIRYDTSSITAKLELETAEGTEKAAKAQDAMLESVFPAADGRRCLINGTVMEIVGVRPSAKKYPIIVKSVKDGKQYAVSLNTAMHGQEVFKATGGIPTVRTR